MVLANIDVGGLGKGLFDLIDKLFTSDDERQAAKLRLMELAQKGDLAQLAVNAKEAEHGSIFVAGWRPFVGWVCGVAMAWQFILAPILGAALVVAYGGQAPSVPTLDLAAMMPVLLGMLGMSGMRSYDKQNGVARSKLAGLP